MAVYKNEEELLNTDWQAKINKAKETGDYKLAAQYEQARNDKINHSSYTGKQTTTSNYAGWLDPTDYSAIGQQQMSSGASWQDVLDTYNNRLDKASSTVGMEKFVNDDKQQAMLDYILAGQSQEAAQVPTYSYDVNRPTYASKYDSRIDEMLNQILNRDDFSYNAEADPLFQQLRTQYNREGNRAMNDTLAAAAANAGGMNSYAVTAAQQANNYYATQLGDKIPELYQLAYDMYLQDIDNQVRDLGLLQDMDTTQYNRYRDTMSDWENDRNFAYNQYRDQMGDYQWKTSFDYQAGRDEVNDAWREKEWDYGVSQDQLENDWREKEWDYGVSQDENNEEWREKEWDYTTGNNAYDRAMDMIAAGVIPDDDLLEAAGISSEKAAALVASVKEQMGTGKSGGGGSTSGGGNGGKTGGGSDDPDDDNDDEPVEGGSNYAGNEGIDEETIKKMQIEIGVPDDGKWGPNSRSVSGMSASEAYKAYKAGTLAPASDDYEVTNPSGDKWVHVQGFGRMTWVELENKVDSGEIEEITDTKNKTKTFRKAN